MASLIAGTGSAATMSAEESAAAIAGVTCARVLRRLFRGLAEAATALAEVSAAEDLL